MFITLVNVNRIGDFLPNNRLSDRVKRVINRGEYGISERLAQAMKNAGYTQGRLAKDVGMAQSSVKLLKDANGSRKTVEIASVLGVRPEWLSAGEGEMVSSGAREATELYQVKPSVMEFTAWMY
jgi:hypothetical protein